MKLAPFRVDATKWPAFADRINRFLAASDGETIEELYNGMRTAYGVGGSADPLAGTTIPDTNVRWNASTEPQGEIANVYAELQLDRSTLQAALDANVGPIDPRYMSYEQWWLVAGVDGDPSVKPGVFIATTDAKAGGRAQGFSVPDGW